MISWITETIAIGEYSDALNKEALIQSNVDCILSLRGGELEDSSNEEAQFCHNLGIAFFRVPIHDMDYWTNHESGKGQFKVKIQCRVAAYMLDLLTEKYKRIMVHCTSGIDRAPFVVAYYMGKIDNGYSMTKSDLKFWISKAYKFIEYKRPQIIEHMEWV